MISPLLSEAYCISPIATWRKLDKARVLSAVLRTLPTVGIMMPASTPIMAMTVSSSTRVNARFRKKQGREVRASLKEIRGVVFIVLRVRVCGGGIIVFLGYPDNKGKDVPDAFLRRLSRIV